MKIALLGGAFNPPHLGHVLIAKQLLDSRQFDQVWLVPCYRHTFNKDLAASSHRLKMAKLMTTKNIVLCEEEIKNRLDGETIKLMTLLAKKYPQHQFSFVISSDNLRFFHKWGRWQTLVTKFPFIIFPRPGFGNELKKYHLDKPQYQFIVFKAPRLKTSALSSTQIREKIKKGLSLDRLVSLKVKQYLKTHHLYESRNQ